MGLHLSSHINLLSLMGLLSDIVGVILLFFNGLPSPIEKASNNLVWSESSMSPRKERQIQRLAWLGLLLIFIGFLLQGLGCIFILSF